MTLEENEPLSSDDENSSKNITLEDVIEECGSCGRFQYIHFFFLTFFPIASGICNFYYVFGAATPSFKCHVVGKPVPGNNIEILSTQCFYLIKNDLNGTIGEYPCTDWIYDRTIFGKTFTEEANLVCENSFRRSYISTMLQIGAMLIFFVGQITDTIGRRRSIQLLVGIVFIPSIITQTLLQFIPMSTNYKFALLLINQFVSGLDAYVVSFLLLIEITTSTHVTFAGILALLGFTFGEIVVAAMAYMCRHWLLLKWTMSLYILALLPYLFFVPESPHWLLTKHRYNELETLLRQIARCNGRSNLKWLQYYRYVVQNHRREKDMNRRNKIQLSFSSKIYRFLTHIPTMSKLLITGLLGFVTLLIYFKVSYSLGAMDEIDPYLNIIIGAIVEGIGYIIPSLFMIRFGRKPIFILFLIPTVVCLLITPLVDVQSRFIVILIAQLGKFAISGAVCVTYLYVPELFPTSIRATGMGFFILFSRFGSTAGPMIDAAINHNRLLMNYMYYLCALLTGFCVLLVLLLPETRNVPLADKIDYNTNKNQKQSLNT